MNAPEFAVLADDLTGAADWCAAFAGYGFQTAVFFEGESGEVCDSGSFGAIAFDTDSRSAPPEEARRRVLEAGKNTRRARVAYKKIDSTLRGNVAVEISAMMEATGRERAVVAPAFPRAGRTTVGGTQFARGVPVHETDFARDPKTPARESRLPNILSDLGDVRLLSVRHLDDAEVVRRAVEENRIVVADATGDSHLRSLVRAVPEPSRVLWVGSAGLASVVSDALTSAPSRRSGAAPSLSPSRTGGVLFVVGSLSEVSREQLRSLERNGTVLVPVEDESGVSGAREVLRSGGRAAIHSPREVSGGAPGEVAGMLARAAGRLEGCFGSLVMTGGDTAVAVARRLEARGIEVFGEVEPGVPHGVLIGPNPCRVVTKAGGFGVPTRFSAPASFCRGSPSKGK